MHPGVGPWKSHCGPAPPSHILLLPLFLIYITLRGEDLGQVTSLDQFAIEPIRLCRGLILVSLKSHIYPEP